MTWDRDADMTIRVNYIVRELYLQSAWTRRDIDMIVRISCIVREIASIERRLIASRYWLSDTFLLYDFRDLITIVITFLSMSMSYKLICEF